MANLEVTSWDKKKVGTVEIDSAVVESPVRKDILHTVVRWQLACRRQGTHKAKTRGEVAGTSKKPYKQKGTGNARRGTQKSPLIRGGGVHFAPRPRDYSYVLPRKVKQAGLRSALSYLHAEGRFHVVDSVDAASGKTKDTVNNFKKFGASKAVVVSADVSDTFKRSSANVKDICYYSCDGLNVYDLLKYDCVVVTKDSIPAIEKRCGVGE